MVEGQTSEFYKQGQTFHHLYGYTIQPLKG